MQLTVELVELRAARGQPRLALALRCVRGLHEGLEGAHDLGRALVRVRVRDRGIGQMRPSCVRTGV